MQREGAPSPLYLPARATPRLGSTIYLPKRRGQVVTATLQAFRDQAEFTGQLSKSGGNSDLIEYLSKEVVTNTVLREHLLKGIADDLPMKNDFEAFSDFLRDEAERMDNKGKPNEASDQVASGHTGDIATQHPSRGKGQYFS